MLLLSLLPETMQNALHYQRSTVANAEYWRLISGHLLHSNYWHLAMNLGGLALVMLLHGSYHTSWQLWLRVATASLLISIAIYLWSPDIAIYVGLSGVLHALLCWGALVDIQRKEPTGSLLLIGLIGKVGWEQWHGADAQLAALINAEVAIDAHLYGLISGMLLWCATLVCQRFWPANSSSR